MIVNGSVGEVATELAKLCAPQQKGAETCTYRVPTQQELSRHVRRFGRDGIVGVEGALGIDPTYLDPPPEKKRRPRQVSEWGPGRPLRPWELL